MPDEPSTEVPRWRIPKACEECRRRKIRCDGREPCQHCQARNSECEYRGFVRQRKRKHELVAKDIAGEAHGEGDGRGVRAGGNNAKVAGAASSSDVTAAAPLTASTSGSASASSSSSSSSSSSLPKRPASRPAATTDAAENRNSVINYSVAATHVASPSCVIQLYYGPSSNFSLMQLMYRQLVEGYGETTSRSDEVEEAGPGLDLFSHRRLFFGDLAGNQDMSIPERGNLSSTVFFLHPSTSSRYLDRYLSTIYHLMPWQPKDEYRRRLELLYDRQSFMSLDSPQATIILLMLAIGASMMDDIDQGNFIFQRAKANTVRFDELVNLHAIQIPLLMIKRARPNSAYLYLGTAVRKAIAAGLHKNTLLQAERTTGDVNEKRATFWSLYFYETWVCFGLGRPMCIPAHEIAIPDPKEQPMMLALVELSRIMTKSARNIYGQRYESLLPLWKSAREVRKDLQCFARRVHGVLSFGLDAAARHGEVGVCQTILMLLYHTVTLLTFRPFLIFRARWRRDGPSKSAEAQAIPTWLDEACESCLEAARCIIRYLSDSYQVNDLVRSMKYHGFFLESACFTLAFDMMHMTPQMAEKHLPWVRLGYRCLASMLPKNQFQEQISVTMSAIQQMLMAVFPNLAAAGGANVMSMGQTGPASDEYLTRNKDFAEAAPPPAPPPHPPSASLHQQRGQPLQQQHSQSQPQQQNQAYTTSYSPNSDPFTNPSAFFNSLSQNLMMTTTTPATGDGSTESNAQDDQLSDFPPLDMNWGDFDFSSMDLDAFLSFDTSAGTGGMNPWGGIVNPNANASANNTNDLGLGLGQGVAFSR